MTRCHSCTTGHRLGTMIRAVGATAMIVGALLGWYAFALAVLAIGYLHDVIFGLLDWNDWHDEDDCECEDES